MKWVIALILLGILAMQTSTSRFFWAFWAVMMACAGYLAYRQAKRGGGR